MTPYKGPYAVFNREEIQRIGKVFKTLDQKDQVFEDVDEEIRALDDSIRAKVHDQLSPNVQRTPISSLEETKSRQGIK